MKSYRSLNEIDSFTFHDSWLDSVAFRKSDMIWVVEYLNVDKANSQNDKDMDMRIRKATVTFRDYSFVTFYHPNTGLLQPITKVEILEILNNETVRFSFVFSREGKSNGMQVVDVEFILSDSLKQFSIEFSSVIIEWDEYYGKAYWVR